MKGIHYMIIRRFEETDAPKVSDLIRETLRISNTLDYPAEIMEELIRRHTPEYVLQRAGWTLPFPSLIFSNIRSYSPNISDFP